MKMNTNLLFLLLILVCDALGAPPQKRSKIFAKGPMGNILDVNLNMGYSYYQGDIKLRLRNPQDKNAILDENLKWTPVVPYEIHQQFPFEVKEQIEAVLREYSVRLCVDFARRGNETNYLMYTKDSGCYSSVGMIGNEQTVSIGDGCESDGVIKHETMHALGFWHEQSRYDRDTYVQILWENIQSGKEHNFDKFTEEQITTLGEPYDYSSIMHYHETAFSSNGEPTIVALEEGGENMGQREGFSLIDLRKLRKLYNCDAVEGWTDWTDWSECDIQCQKYRKRFCEGTNCTEEVETEWQGCDEQCVVGQDHDCPSAIVNGSYGIVTSPMFPYNYKINVECTQTIMAPPGENIKLIFEFLDVEDYQGICYYDWIKLYDGSDVTAPLAGTFCGTSAPPTFVSTGNSLTINFFSDISVSRRGFLANYITSEAQAPLHVCHFEGNPVACGWSQDGADDFDWTRTKGPTSSDGTGPSFDHTTKQDQGYYMFIETSSPQTAGMKARLLSPIIPAPSNGNCLEFSYNMFGENIDTLRVFQLQEVSPGEDEVFTIFTASGNHGNNDWITARLNIYGQFSYQLIFQATRGNGWKGDIAIDDVTIYSRPCVCEQRDVNCNNGVPECAK